jgi:predicted CoA-binding protein
MPVSKQLIDEFVSQPALAVVGVSRNEQKFCNMAYRELKKRGYRLYPINPVAETVEGEKAYPSLKSLPEAVGAALIMVQPDQTEKVVREAAEAGIRRVWIQQGAESDAALRFCEENGISVVHGQCIMMFMKNPEWYHGIHRWVLGVSGQLPS